MTFTTSLYLFLCTSLSPRAFSNSILVPWLEGADLNTAKSILLLCSKSTYDISMITFTSLFLRNSWWYLWTILAVLFFFFPSYLFLYFLSGSMDLLVFLPLIKDLVTQMEGLIYGILLNFQTDFLWSCLLSCSNIFSVITVEILYFLTLFSIVIL